MEKLYIKPADMPDQENMRSFKSFLTALYERKNKNGYLTFPATYTSKNYHLKKMQCKGGKARSFSDLLIIGNTYFEKVTPQELLRVIYSIIGLEDTGPMLIYCPEVRKIVFHTSNWRRTKIFIDEDNESHTKNSVLVDYLFYDYAKYVTCNKLEYDDDFDFFTVMSYIGLDRQRLVDKLIDLQDQYEGDIENINPF